MVLLPLFYIISKKFEDIKCWFRQDFEPNKLKNRVSRLQYPANNPIEDRYDYTQLSSIDAFVVSVFDGHGGWQTAEYAKNHLSHEIESKLA